MCLALWGVNDPGNVGTALRSALAFGANSVALGPGTADPYGHKAVRASMGALFEVPVVRAREVSELPGRPTEHHHNDPEARLMAFLQTTYRAAADLGRWDRGTLECATGIPGRLRVTGGHRINWIGQIAASAIRSSS